MMRKKLLGTVGIVGLSVVMLSLGASAQSVSKWGPDRPPFTTIVKDKGTKGNAVKARVTVNALGVSSNIASHTGPFTNSVTVRCSNGHELSHTVFKAKDANNGSVSVLCPFGTVAQTGKGFVDAR